jgi:tetratricopeptide (TPR) repeat protein
MYDLMVAGGVSLKQQPARGALVPVALPGLEALAAGFEAAPGETGMRVENAALTLTRGSAGGIEQADSELLSAVQLFNSGDTARAYLRAQRMLEAAPDRTEVLTLRAEAAVELGLYRLAERDLHHVYALTGAEQETRLAFTSLAIREGTLSDFSAIPPDDRAALGTQFVARAAMLLAMRQDIAGALVQSDIAVRLAPEMSQVYGTRGGIRIALGETAAGTADLDRAIALDPNIAKYHFLRAFVALQTEDYAAAAKHAGSGMHLSEGRDLMDYVLIRGISRVCLGGDAEVCAVARAALQSATPPKPPAAPLGGEAPAHQAARPAEDN